MEFCDLNRQYNKYKSEIDSAISNVIQSSAFINGPEVKELENELAQFIGVNFALGCSNGTEAIFIALMALGSKAGDEILVPDFTFFATAEMPALIGATPVFVDINPNTFTMDLDDLKKKITKKTKGIIPVSLFGQCAEMDSINEIASEYDLWVIEDAAQSFGAKYKNRYSGNLSTISTTSFFPAKPLGCYGDGGAIFTNDAELAGKMKMIINHGQEKRYHHKIIGLNGRIDSIQAAILRVKLRHFNEELELRNQIAQKYTEKLKGVFQTPVIDPNNTSTWAQYTITHEKRSEIVDFLKTRNIPTAIHYPIPMHMQEALKKYAPSQGLNVSASLSQTVFSLPMHPFLELNEIDEVCNALFEAVKKK